jgi:hypothetical protein
MRQTDCPVGGAPLLVLESPDIEDRGERIEVLTSKTDRSDVVIACALSAMSGGIVTLVIAWIARLGC